MRRGIILALLGVVLAGVGYLVIFKKKQLGQLADSASGFPDAKSPKEAVDLFRKAIKERSYKMAAKYCTKPFADDLLKGAEAGTALGEQIDALVSRMNDDKVMTDELRLILFYYDPFWKELNPTISNETATDATAIIKLEGLTIPGTQVRPFEQWSINAKMFRTLSRSFPLPGGVYNVPVKKEGEIWKLSFTVTTDQQQATTFLNDHYMDYAKPFKILSAEIKRDPQTKEDVKKRLKELLEEASRN